MRIGLLAYSSNTGLGVQTQEFAEHIKPAKVMLVDLSGYNGMAIHPERFASFECVHVYGVPTDADIEKFLTNLDVVFVCETPLNYRLFSRARELGVKTILQPNHEFNDYYPRPYLPQPDLFALPSPWAYDELPFPNKMLLAVPVATEKLLTQMITEFRRFLHIAGRPAVHDRNGTLLLIEAFKLVNDPSITLAIRVQDSDAADALRATIVDPRIIVLCDDVLEYSDIYDGYDCLIMPRRYGGLCLPMQEALGCGIPVIMPDISPNNMMLPKEWLVPATQTASFMARTEIAIYDTDIQELRNIITRFADMGRDRVAYHVSMSHNLGLALSWAQQRENYLDVFESTLFWNPECDIMGADIQD
jgi:glycosyltransferase involved in cell wall biosynthesis